MSALELTEPWPRRDCENSQYYSCALCGPQYSRYEIRYDAGTVAPTVGETVTGVTSGATGVVVSNAIEAGSFASGDAIGTVELGNVTGGADGLAFSDDETLTGETSFAGVANGRAIEKVYGLVYPAEACIERDGKRYCAFHYRLRFRKRDEDAEKIDIDEESEA